MGEFVSRNNGMFFEYKQNPQERKEAEYRKRLRMLESRVELLEGQLAILLDIIKEANNG